MANYKRQDYRERGAELVEFALILPLLLLIVLGTIEFGRAYYTYHLLTKAFEMEPAMPLLVGCEAMELGSRLTILLSRQGPRMLWFTGRRRCQEASPRSFPI